MKKQETKLVVIRTCKENGSQEEVSFQYAVEKLKGYWIEVENMLMSGNVLDTPFANYQLKN
jgi:hypothetical protein